MISPDEGGSNAGVVIEAVATGNNPQLERCPIKTLHVQNQTTVKNNNNNNLLSKYL